MTRAAHLPVFLSTTYPMNGVQESVVEAAKRALREIGLTPLSLPRGFWSFEAPLVPVRRLMRRCCGTVVLAMARSRVDAGVDFVECERAEPYRRRYLSTDWAQIEAAIAFQLEHPILMFREERVHPHGLLDPAHSGMPVHTFRLGDRGIREALGPCLADFRQGVRAYAAQHERGVRLRQLGS